MKEFIYFLFFSVNYFLWWYKSDSMSLTSREIWAPVQKKRGEIYAYRILTRKKITPIHKSKIHSSFKYLYFEFLHLTCIYLFEFSQRFWCVDWCTLYSAKLKLGRGGCCCCSLLQILKYSSRNQINFFFSLVIFVLVNYWIKPAHAVQETTRIFFFLDKCREIRKVTFNQ